FEEFFESVAFIEFVEFFGQVDSCHAADRGIKFYAPVALACLWLWPKAGKDSALAFGVLGKQSGDVSRAEKINPVCQNSLPAWAGEAQPVDWFCLADKTMAERDVAPRANQKGPTGYARGAPERDLVLCCGRVHRMLK
ncbi:MAG: hypothetical protein PHF12_03120, partial [Candidatus Omnitrophica bacterium]|nr:hypothetical protein [Candidatus Omnitrophota bacterium]